MEHLAAQRTGRGARKALSDMPQNLNETYERLVSRVHADSPDRRLLHRTLLWLSFAARPLSLLELGDAVVLEDGDTGFDDDSRLRYPEILVELARGLLDYDQETKIVSLAHSSIKTFLTSKWIRQSSVADFALEETSAHRILMKKCLMYLCFSEFKIGAGRSHPINESVAAKYPLLAYAAHNWTLHIKNISKEDWGHHINPLLSTRVLPHGGNFGFWIQCITKFHSCQIIQRTSPLYYAASFGYVNLVRAILDFDQTVDLEQPGGQFGSTALQVACFYKQQEIVRLLVKAGGDCFSPDGSQIEGGFTSFFWAQSNGWEDIMELMTRLRPIYGNQESSNSLPAYMPSSVALAHQVQEEALQIRDSALSMS